MLQQEPPSCQQQQQTLLISRGFSRRQLVAIGSRDGSGSLTNCVISAELKVPHLKTDV